MYSQQELDDAVASGALTASAADALRAHVESQRSTAIPDEEQFRLITGFNDIFVSIAAAILLIAVGWIGQSVGQALGIVVATPGQSGPSFLAPLFTAATAWGLALYFTAKRRMALPSILLVFAFVIGVFFTVAMLEGQVLFSMIGEQRLKGAFQGQEELAAKAFLGTMGAIAFALAVVAAWFHWRRFRVPVTVAAGAMAVAGIFLAIIAAILAGQVADLGTVMLGFTLVLGIGVFLFAMWWDSSDRARLTRRSDVAFWLHLLAAPMIAHPIFTLMGLNNGVVSAGEALGVVALYVLFGLTALAVDRRALLVSALAYVLYALIELFKSVGAVQLNVALTFLVIGSALLLLSAFWHQARRLVVTKLPANLQERLPNLDRPAISQSAA